MHPVEWDNWQVFHLFIAFSSVQSFCSAVLHFIEPKVSTAKNRVKALPDPISVERNDKNIREN